MSLDKRLFAVCSGNSLHRHNRVRTNPTACSSSTSVTYEEVRGLIDQGANPNVFYKGSTPLCELARLGGDSLVEMLIQNGADINLCDKNRCSPLYLASSHGNLKAVKLLINAGADVNIKNLHGYPPLLSAVENGHMAVAGLLIENGAQVNVARPNTFGVQMSLLTFVIFAKNDLSFAETLLDAGVIPHQFEKPLGFILLECGDDSRNFIKKLVFAGFNFYCDGWIKMTRSKISGDLADVSDNQKEMLTLLELEHRNAASLQRLCRTVVRTCLAQSPITCHIQSKISQLPLPTAVKKYISLEYL